LKIQAKKTSSLLCAEFYSCRILIFFTNHLGELLIAPFVIRAHSIFPLKLLKHRTLPVTCAKSFHIISKSHNLTETSFFSKWLDFWCQVQWLVMPTFDLSGNLSGCSIDSIPKKGDAS